MKSDLLIEWYKGKVERILSDPEPDILNNVMDQLDIDDTWGKIEDSLDIEQVWNNVSNVIHQPPIGLQSTWGKFIRVFTSGILGILVILMPGDSGKGVRPLDENSVGSILEGSTLNTISSGKPTDDITGLAETNKLSETAEFPTIKITATGPQVISKPAQKWKPEAKTPVIIIDSLWDDTTFHILVDEASSDPPESTTRESRIITPMAPYSGFPDLKTPSINLGRNGSFLSAPRSKSYFFGSSMHAKNVWIINNKLYRGLDPDELLTIVPVIKMDAGFFMGKQINSNLDGLVAFNIFSKSSQKYKDYSNGYYNSNELELNYFKVSFIIKHRYRPNWLNENLPLSWTSMGGLYFSNLTSAHFDDGKEERYPNNYIGVDFGLLWGHELELKVGSRLIIAPGFRFYFGLPDISGNSLISKPGFTQERNASVDFTFSIYFFK